MARDWRRSVAVDDQRQTPARRRAAADLDDLWSVGPLSLRSDRRRERHIDVDWRGNDERRRRRRGLLARLDRFAAAAADRADERLAMMMAPEVVVALAAAPEGVTLAGPVRKYDRRRPQPDDRPRRGRSDGRGDERRLVQVLLNVISNAIKFTDVGAVTIRARAVGDMFEIEVKDTGPGIAPEDRRASSRRSSRPTPAPRANTAARG